MRSVVPRPLPSLGSGRWLSLCSAPGAAASMVGWGSQEVIVELGELLLEDEEILIKEALSDVLGQVADADTIGLFAQLLSLASRDAEFQTIRSDHSSTPG